MTVTVRIGTSSPDRTPTVRHLAPVEGVVERSELPVVPLDGVQCVSGGPSRAPLGAAYREASESRASRVSRSLRHDRAFLATVVVALLALLE